MATASDTAADALRALARLPSFTSGSLQQVVVKHLPRATKYFVLFVLALNWRSLPFQWHLRVFAPVIATRARWYLLRLRLLFASKKVREDTKRRWLEGLSPVGKSPFDEMIRHPGWAGIDDCDYNFHLSNSCYAKNLDAVRLKAALAYFPGFMRAGGWSALGGTHFHFIREIPMFAKYEVRMNIASWDNKWTFIIARFVTFPKKSAKSSAASKTDKAPAPSSNARATPSGNAPPFPTLHTPASVLTTPSPSGVSTPALASTTSEATDMGAAMRELAARSAATEEADGATLNCISVNELVFKHGRITVPPGIVFAAEGMCAARGHSRAHPPPHWARVQALWAHGPRALAAFYRGGWREVPEGARWWEDAMGGEIEERRRAQLELVKSVRTGMDGARALVGA